MKTGKEWKIKFVLLICTAFTAFCLSCSHKGYGTDPLGHLRIASAAGPALVFVNERRRGTTPLTVPFSEIKRYPMVVSAVSLKNAEFRQELKFDTPVPKKIVVLKYADNTPSKQAVAVADSPQPETTVVEKQVVLLAPTFFFQTDRYDLQAGAMAELRAFAEQMARNPLNMVILGYADERASAAYNRQLSLNRALAVFNALRQLGLAGERMQVEGRGKILPVDGAGNPLSWSHARRVEIMIVGSNPEEYKAADN